jgi:hypothetical protein
LGWLPRYTPLYVQVLRIFGDNLVSWSARRQPTVSCSSAEAEYKAVASGAAETCLLHHLLLELHRPLDSATIVYCDNIYICPSIQHSIGVQNTLRWTFILFVRWLSARFEFSMFRLVHSLQTSSPRDSLLLPSPTYAPVSTSSSLTLPLGGGGGGYSVSLNPRLVCPPYINSVISHISIQVIILSKYHHVLLPQVKCKFL